MLDKNEDKFFERPSSPIVNTKRKVAASASFEDHEGHKCKKTKPNYHEKPYVRIRVQDILENLGAKSPFFLKCMIPSDVVKNKSSLTLPKQFCNVYLPNHDTKIILKHQNGEEYEVKYLSKYRRLSGGWRRFETDNKLVEGDLLIFQWVKPLMKFKVYKVDEDTLPEVEAAFTLLRLTLQ